MEVLGADSYSVDLPASNEKRILFPCVFPIVSVKRLPVLLFFGRCKASRSGDGGDVWTSGVERVSSSLPRYPLKSDLVAQVLHTILYDMPHTLYSLLAFQREQRAHRR